MSFLKICSETPFTIYQCRHIPSGALYFCRIQSQPHNIRGGEINKKAIVRSIQQTLKRPITSRSPIERKEINKFVIDHKFNLSTEGIHKEWVFQEFNTVPEYLIPAYINELVAGARRSNKIVLNVFEKMLSNTAA